MKTIIIAAIAANGVVGRTRKPCPTCAALRSVLGVVTKVHLCTVCGGEETIAANDLPWGRAYPEDLARFKTLTSDADVGTLWGSMTWLGMPPKARARLAEHTPDGMPRAIVMTRGTHDDQIESGPVVARFLDRALDNARDMFGLKTLYIGGGPRLWRDALPIADELDLTLIGRAWPGDVRFPHGYFGTRRQSDMVVGASFCDSLDTYAFDCVSREPCPTNLELTFTRWVRR